jgi:threonylcarbamoyladenosine tRNA methylthiotransferase MtaB
MPTVHLCALGCRLNQAELEGLAAALRAAGHRLVPTPDQADWVVLNTCTVTHRADADSRAMLRRIHRQAPQARIAVTGCWSEVNPSQAADLPGVDLVVSNADKSALAGLLGPVSMGPVEAARAPIPGPRRRARAFLAVQDGCDQACAYCLTTIARGPARSTPLPELLAQAQAAEAGGAGELVVCGVQLSSWGHDLPGRPHLGALLDALLAGTTTSRIRLSSLEPWGLPGDLFARWADPRLCRQLHLPLQSGCDATLARMGRPYRRGDAADLIAQARAHIPQLALTSDVMVGFPGENEAEFAESCAWLEALLLADVHVFTFSPRPGTPAADMPDPVPVPAARKRRQLVLERLAPAREAFRRSLLASTQDVLWVRSAPAPGGGWDLRGLTDHGVPVQARSDRDRWRGRSEVVLGRDGVEILP